MHCGTAQLSNHSNNLHCGMHAEVSSYMQVHVISCVEPSARLTPAGFDGTTVTGASGVTILMSSLTTAMFTKTPCADALAATGTVTSTLSPAPQPGPRLQLKLLPLVVQDPVKMTKVTTK